MNALRHPVAHGGMGAAAGLVAPPPQVTAILRGTTATIRVWNGCFGDAEEFTIREARALCVEGDRALMDAGSASRAFGRAMLFVGPDDDRMIAAIDVDRQWLIAFLAALRKALRVHDAACNLAIARQMS